MMVRWRRRAAAGHNYPVKDQRAGGLGPEGETVGEPETETWAEEQHPVQDAAPFFVFNPL
jgi:hypothetical protein